jgi:hypothetical protein|tara:strand:- start:20 stop:250 length:231 start_codon:yes stop_codon:yes gene_type:complete
MKKLLWIIVLSLLLSGNGYAASATCMGGECEFFLSLHYEWAETSCYQTLFMEDVETNFMSFTIVETEEQCIVWNSR